MRVFAYICTLIINNYDIPHTLHIAIIGGGAAGFFAAIAAKRKQPHADVTIFEKLQKVLAKVEITGGGKCNLTNSFEEISSGSKRGGRAYIREEEHI